MLSTGAHNPRVAKLLKDPNEKLVSKLPEKEPEKEEGVDSQEEKEKENSGYTFAQEEDEKDSEEYVKEVSCQDDSPPQEVSPTPQEVSPEPQEVCENEPPQEEKDNWRLNLSSNKPNSFSDIDAPEYKLKSTEADEPTGAELPLALLGNAMPLRGNVILLNS